MKYASAQPYTDEERERDDLIRQRAQKTIHNRRKATPSGQNYNVPATKSSILRDRAIMGEREAS
jgi:hypothetical protein